MPSVERPDPGVDLTNHDRRLRSLERLIHPYPHVNMTIGLGVSSPDGLAPGAVPNGEIRNLYSGGSLFSGYTDGFRHQNSFEATGIGEEITVRGYTFQPFVKIVRDGYYLAFAQTYSRPYIYDGIVDPADGIAQPFMMQDTPLQDRPFWLEAAPAGDRLIMVGPEVPSYRGIIAVNDSGDDEWIGGGGENSVLSTRDLVISFRVANANIDPVTGEEFEDPADYQPYYIFGKAVGDFSDFTDSYAALIRMTVIRLWEPTDTFVG